MNLRRETLSRSHRTWSGSAQRVHTPVDCEPQDACTTGACDPGTGQCRFAPIDCDDGDPCTINRCDPVAGCVHTRVECEGDLVCVGGQCLQPCPGSDDGYVRDWRAPTLSPERHLSYAGQWLALGLGAFAAAIVMAVKAMRRGR